MRSFLSLMKPHHSLWIKSKQISTLVLTGVSEDTCAFDTEISALLPGHRLWSPSSWPSRWPSSRRGWPWSSPRSRKSSPLLRKRAKPAVKRKPLAPNVVLMSCSSSRQFASLTRVHGASQLDKALEGEVGDVRGRPRARLGVETFLVAPPSACLLPVGLLLLVIHWLRVSFWRPRH